MRAMASRVPAPWSRAAVCAAADPGHEWHGASLGVLVALAVLRGFVVALGDGSCSSPRCRKAGAQHPWDLLDAAVSRLSRTAGMDTLPSTGTNGLWPAYPRASQFYVLTGRLDAATLHIRPWARVSRCSL